MKRPPPASLPACATSSLAQKTKKKKPSDSRLRQGPIKDPGSLCRSLRIPPARGAPALTWAQACTTIELGRSAIIYWRPRPSFFPDNYYPCFLRPVVHRRRLTNIARSPRRLGRREPFRLRDHAANIASRSFGVGLITYVPATQRSRVLIVKPKERGGRGVD